MPLIDFGKKRDGQELNLKKFEYTIIGCGAIGIHVALLLAKRGKSVLILESGKIGEHPERQILNKSTTNRPDIASSVHWGRKRALGGSTIRWGGQALPFQSIDFAERPWLKLNGWPLSAEDLEPHYRQAERYLGVGTGGYFGTAMKRLKLKPPFNSEDLDYHVSKWASQPNMFKRHQKKLEKDTTILYNAHCTEVIRDSNKRCKAVTIKNFDQKSLNIQIQNLIIASGGIESVRFLMVNNLSKSPFLGQGFMEHPCMDLGTINSSNTTPLQKFFATRLIKWQKYGIRLSLSENAQREHELVNASVSLMFETPDDAFDPLQSFSSLLRRKQPRALWQLMKNWKFVVKSAWAFFRYGIVLKPFAKIRVTTMCEQLASDGSTLALDSEHSDQFGIPRLKVDWQISEATWKSARFIAQTIKSEIEHTFKSNVQLRPELVDTKDAFDSFIFSSVNHHMGGAKMGTEPSNSVVDPSLKLHDFENIWLCSSSVFPTSSHSNPTLTALALGGRLVDSLSETPFN